jgi:serine/threonine-protein kinase MRCK
LRLLDKPLSFIFIAALKFVSLLVAGFCDGHLLVYSETHVDVFNCASGEWVQTINVKKAKPLNSTGTLSMCIINDMPHIIYLSNVHQRKSFKFEFSEM